MAIEHMSDEQLDSIVAHARRRNLRYMRKVRELNCAIVENNKNAVEACQEQDRRKSGAADQRKPDGPWLTGDWEVPDA